MKLLIDLFNTVFSFENRLEAKFMLGLFSFTFASSIGMLTIAAFEQTGVITLQEGFPSEVALGIMSSIAIVSGIALIKAYRFLHKKNGNCHA